MPPKGKNSNINSTIQDIPLGGKVFDTRTIVGGEVQSKAPGKHKFVIALDFSAQYPAQTEANNISTSTRVDERVLKNPSEFGLEIVEQKSILDSYGRREIYWLKRKELEKIYRVEQFNCTFKIDIDELGNQLSKYYNLTNNGENYDLDDEIISNSNTPGDNIAETINTIKQLYPEAKFKSGKWYNHNNNKLISEKHNIPETVTKKVYYVQSEKAENGWTKEHLSLNEIMLTDLRFKRNAVKKQMAQAEKNGNEFDAIRYNSKQLAIKIVCNSTYGASGSRFYAFYDPTIGASITWAAREMIHNLTKVLESTKIFVDEKFINENSKQFNILEKYGLLKRVNWNYENCNNDESNNNNSNIESNDNLENVIALSLRRLYDERWNLLSKDSIVKLEMKPAKIIYQDTDSNYYIIPFVQEIFSEKYSPEDISECMNLMKMHNEFFQQFMALSVFRPPIGLGFEAAKIIARYMNVKKRYYGIEWHPDMESKLSSDAYCNNILIPDYDKYWKPGKTTLPRADGTYIKVSPEELLDEGVDFVNYTHHQNLSITGMPLTRRDAYRFTNYLNLVVYQRDLTVMKYLGDNKWTKNSTELEVIINDVINMFREQKDYVEQIIEDYENNVEREYKLSKPFFRLKDYSRQVQYKPDKDDKTMRTIISRYEKNNRRKIETFERINYVVMDNEDSRQKTARGMASYGQVSDLAKTIEELNDEYREKYPEKEFNKRYIGKSEIKYDDFIEIAIIKDLCYRHYLEALCKTLSPFAVEYLRTEELTEIREDNTLSDNDRRDKIKEITDKAAKDLYQEYYKLGKNVLPNIEKIKNANEKKYLRDKQKLKKSAKEINLFEKIHELCPKLPHTNNLTSYRDYLINYRDTMEKNMRDIELAKEYCQNNFSRRKFMNENIADYMEIIKENNPDDISEIDDYYKRISIKYYKALAILDEMP